MNNDEYTLTEWRNCDCSIQLHHYITRDGGHSWPGGQQTVTGDPVSAYINANDLMWAFFQEHSLDCKVTTSLDKYDPGNTRFVIYPNPSSGIFRISGPGSKASFGVTVFDITGKKIIRMLNNKTIDLTSHKPGIYHVILNTGKEVFRKKNNPEGRRG